MKEDYHAEDDNAHDINTLGTNAFGTNTYGTNANYGTGDDDESPNHHQGVKRELADSDYTPSVMRRKYQAGGSYGGYAGGAQYQTRTLMKQLLYPNNLTPTSQFYEKRSHQIEHGILDGL
ncbi:hypothetical protein KCU92_g2954, partial [Aureobasidium melanogenum]|jgi:hypothetical protein